MRGNLLRAPRWGGGPSRGDTRFPKGGGLASPSQGGRWRAGTRGKKAEEAIFALEFSGGGV